MYLTHINVHVFNISVFFQTFFENKSFVIPVIVDCCFLLMFEITFIWRGSVEQRVIVAEINLVEN